MVETPINTSEEIKLTIEARPTQINPGQLPAEKAFNS